jgi:hypothetical protein
MDFATASGGSAMTDIGSKLPPPPTHLLIDSNVYLRFYDLTNEDLEELRKLVALVEGHVTLYLTSQIRDEIRRNRETVLHRAIGSAKKSVKAPPYPQALRNYTDEFAETVKAFNTFATSFGRLVDQALIDAKARALHADHLLEELFARATELPVGDDVMRAAERRAFVGNPPGKPGSNGDALNWEALLLGHDDTFGFDVHLVTADNDFASPFDSTRLHELLADEWTKRYGTNVWLYPDVTTFFRQHHPEIRVAAELTRQLAVNSLVSSWSFKRTHECVAKLSEVSGFTDTEVEDLFHAAIANKQINTILSDDDVSDFYWRLVRDHRKQAEPQSVAEVIAQLDVQF